MPATGYLQVTQWNSVAYASGALTGITATCAADPVFGTFDRVGFMIDVGRDATNTNVSRLNNPSDDPFLGDWFLMGITDGTRATTYQIPNNGDAMYVGGVQVETSPGSNTYEWWPVTTSDMTSYNIRTTGEAAKQCHITPASAVIRFGHDGTNSTGGACPVSGCKIRVPNMFLQGCTAAAPTVNSFSAINSRHYFYANGAGRWRVTGVSSTWRQNLITNAYEIYAADSSFCHSLTISGNATEYELDNICVSTPVDDGIANSALTFSSAFVGGTATDCVFSIGKTDGVSKYPLSITTSANSSFDNCKFMSSGMPSTGGAAVSSSIAANFTFENCYFIGRQVHSQSSAFIATDCTFGGITAGDPWENGSGLVWLTLSNKCSEFLYEDWTFPESECLGKSTFIALSGASSNNKFRNLGSYLSPVSSRSAIIYDAAWSRSGTTITVTATAHGFRTGDFIRTLWSSASNTTGLGLEIITYIDANTFSFVGVGSGDTSGTVSLIRIWTSSVITCSGGSENNEFQNIFVDGCYSLTADITNTSYTTTLLNVSGGIAAGLTLGGNDMITRGVQGNNATPGATAAQYGHSFTDGSTLPSPTTTGGIADTWARTVGSVVVTSVDHGLDTQNTRIRLYDMSDPAALGATAITWELVTALTKDTFLLTGANTGATTGTLTWDVPTDTLNIFMNEESADVSRYTINSGTPAFTGAGALAALTVGDEIEWEMPEYLINYTGFPNIPIATTLAETEAAQGVYRFTYDIATDDGAFSGTYKNLSLFYASTGGTSGTAIMNFASTTNIAVNDKITGPYVPRGAYVVSVDSATQITISANLTANAAGSYSFNHLPNETFTTNFKLKVRQTTVTTNTLSNTYVAIPLSSDATSRAQVYPIGETVTLTVTAKDSETLAAIENARVYIKADSGGDLPVDTLIATGVTNVSGVFSTTVAYTSDQPIIGWARKATGSPLYKQSQIVGTITSTGFETTSALVPDE